MYKRQGKGSRLKAKNIKASVIAGRLSEQQLNTSVSNLLRVMLLTEHIDSPPKVGQRNTPAHQALALEIAEQSLTLLKNEDQLLPLDPARIKKIAILGPRATSKHCLPLAGGSAGVWPPYEITPKVGLVNENNARFEIVKSASEADVALLFVGLSHKVGNDSEGKDRAALDLPAEHQQLILKTLSLIHI